VDAAGQPGADQRDLGQLAPELSRRLYHWMTSGKLDETATQLADGVPEVVPRFTRLAPNDDSHVLIFLDDTSLLSRRAEELTLSRWADCPPRSPTRSAIRWRRSAIRPNCWPNPKAWTPPTSAWSRSSTTTASASTRSSRTSCSCRGANARGRKRWTWASGRRVSSTEYSQGNDLGSDSLRVIASTGAPVAAVADPQQLQQVVWNLVQNALRYGRLPGEPARVMVVTRQGEHGVPILEVIDRGPGIAPKVAAQIFEPFYTTHEYGTGLGLYLARQMSEANQAALEYVRVAGGGSCFRLVLTPPARSPAEPRGSRPGRHAFDSFCPP
jgi:two-component system sensor histidine kinase PilS (NtrC family)